MSGRLLPDKEQIEQLARDRIVERLAADGRSVVEAIKGDSAQIPFDWLLRLADGLNIGVEVVRAEDQGQVHHIEKESRSGEAVITGTAEMPWDSLRRAVEKKTANVERYREALREHAAERELHLAITSAFQQLVFEGEIAVHIEGVASSALGPFDAVWLIDGETVILIT